MNPQTGEVVRLPEGKEPPPGFVEVSPKVARIMRAGQKALARHTLSKRRR